MKLHVVVQGFVIGIIVLIVSWILAPKDSEPVKPPTIHMNVEPGVACRVTNGYDVHCWPSRTGNEDGEDRNTYD